MRIALCALLLSALTTTSFGASGVYTKTNGIAFGLEFVKTNVVAGERLIGTMVVSNASPAMANIRMSKDWGNRQFDTAIGNFVVMDENGAVLPKTIPYHFQGRMGTRGWPFGPEASERFEGDVVWGYSLTNPGNYAIKASAPLPLTNDSGSFDVFMAETPAILITVTPRPASMPPLGVLYPLPPNVINNPEALAIWQKEEDILKKEEEALQRAAMPPVPRAGNSQTALPPKVQAEVNQTPTTRPDGAPAVEEKRPLARSRNLVYGFVILAILAALGILLRRLGQKERRA